jgi:NAD(P)H-dependent FMN reductase
MIRRLYEVDLQGEVTTGDFPLPSESWEYEEIFMDASRPLFIPVILGTSRMGRMSLHAARLVTQEAGKRAGVETELIDIAHIPLPIDDAGEAIKDPGFSAKMDRADALVIVSPEYNHGYSGLLKHVLDSCLKEYIHKAVGIVGVSAGPFGGARMIQNLLPVMRELGLVTIFWDVSFSAVQKVFDKDGKLLDPAFIGRIDKFLNELIWMAKTLRHGREQIPLE